MNDAPVHALPDPLLVRVDECPSTQVLARALVDDGRPAGTCVVAARQSAGRGRLGRTWLEPAAGLYLSMILRPSCPLAHAPRLTLGAAAGMLAALDELGVSAHVKWPNDVVIAAPQEPEGRLGPFRKVAGILVEAAGTSDARLETAVLGVGANVRAPPGGWPPELALTAGALADAGFAGEVDDVLAAVRAHVPPWLDRALHAFAEVTDVLRARSATLGRRVTVDGIEGVARDLDDEGALLVVDDDDVTQVVRAGDVWLV